MRVVEFVACLAIVVAVPVAAQHHKLETLSPAQVVSRAGAASPKPLRTVVEFKVSSAAKAGTGYYLDSERNYRSPQNLAVAIRASAIPALSKKYGSDLKAAFLGKTVKVIGEVRRLTVGKNHAAVATQLEVTTGGQILAVR